MAGWKYGTTWTVKMEIRLLVHILHLYWIQSGRITKKQFSEDTGININNLDKSDILEITLTPRKISRDNGGKYTISHRLCIEY